MRENSQTRSIRAILLKDWDPLIIGDNTSLSDEYDDVIRGVLELNEQNCTAEQLEQYLTRLEERWKSVPITPTSQVAVSIFKILQYNTNS